MSIPSAQLAVDERAGATPCAVFVHGLSGDLHQWDGLWPLLDPRRRLLRYDLRDHGQSQTAPDAPFTHSDDLAALLGAMKIAQCDLIGVSMGASIALRFALDHPARVRKLVLISPSIAGWEWSPAWAALWAPIAQAARAGRMDEAKRLWLHHPLFDSVRDTPAEQTLRAEIARYSGAAWIHDAHAHVLPDIERLHTLAAPTLLLTGARDMDDFRLIGEILEASVSHLLRADAPGKGHLLHLEAPTFCAEAIEAFLGAPP